MLHKKKLNVFINLHKKNSFCSQNFYFFANLPCITHNAALKRYLGYFSFKFVKNTDRGNKQHSSLRRQVTIIMMNHSSCLYFVSLADPDYLFKTSSSSSHSQFAVQTHQVSNNITGDITVFGYLFCLSL